MESHSFSPIAVLGKILDAINKTAEGYKLNAVNATDFPEFFNSI